MNLYRLIALVHKYDLIPAAIALQDAIVELREALVTDLREGDHRQYARRKIEADVYRLQELFDFLDNPSLKEANYER